MSHYDDIDEARIDLIGQNGNTGEHYPGVATEVSASDFFGAAVAFRELRDPKPQPTPLSVQVLQYCKQVQEERGKQYDRKPGVVGGSTQAERSFQRTATAFNAITGKNLRGSEVAL